MSEYHTKMTQKTLITEKSEDILIKKKIEVIDKTNVRKFNRKFQFYRKNKISIDNNDNDQIKPLNNQEDIKEKPEEDSYLEKIRQLQSLPLEYPNVDESDIYNELNYKPNEEDSYSKSQPHQSHRKIFQGKLKENIMTPKINNFATKLPGFKERETDENLKKDNLMMLQNVPKDKFKFENVPDFDEDFDFYEKLERIKISKSMNSLKTDFNQQTPDIPFQLMIRNSNYKNESKFYPVIGKPIDKKIDFQEDIQDIELQNTQNFDNTFNQLINYKNQVIYSSMKNIKSKRDITSRAALSCLNNDKIKNLKEDNDSSDKYEDNNNEIILDPKKKFIFTAPKRPSHHRKNKNDGNCKSSKSKKSDNKDQVSDKNNNSSALGKKMILVDPKYDINNNTIHEIQGNFSPNLKINNTTYRLKNITQKEPSNILRKQFGNLNFQSAPGKYDAISPKSTNSNLFSKNILI